MSEARKTRLWDKAFKYTPAAKTDIAATFARIRREQAKASAAVVNVTPLKRKASK